MARGKKTGGRKKGTPNKRTVEKRFPAIAGEDPLDFMQRVMEDESVDLRLRADMAKSAAKLKRAAKPGAGKKQEAAEAAQSAGEGTEWGSDLDSPTSSSVN